MLFIDLAPPSWEAVPDDVPTILYASEEVAADTVVTLADALGAVDDEVWIVLYASVEVAAGTVMVDA